MALTAIEVRNAPPGRYADGNGLYLLARSEHPLRSAGTLGLVGRRVTPAGCRLALVAL